MKKLGEDGREEDAGECEDTRKKRMMIGSTTSGLS